MRMSTNYKQLNAIFSQMRGLFEKPSLRLGDVIFRNKVCVFLENNKANCANFFSGFRKNTC